MSKSRKWKGKNGSEDCGKKAWSERDIKKNVKKVLLSAFLLFFYKYVKKPKMER